MDKYTKVKQIGEGAFGKAVLVKAKECGKQFVIKEINMSRMPTKERESSRKEVLVLAQLKHPHIVAYRESFEEHGTLYIVMDYCSGGDLYSKINSQRGLYFQEERIWTWFVQICLAIKHIHDRKILHRDIKSQNIFICGDGTVQIGDFGIAKVLNSTVELARTCIGTPYYLSPELVENKPYNNKSDIWSLGCVLYELTTLKHAFEAGNMKNLVLKIIRGSYPPIPASYSYELRGLIAQLFKRSPRDRPSINSVLKKNFMLPRVRKVLSEEEMESEFSHTVMHGHKLGRALPPAPRPASAASKRPAPAARPSSAQGRYNPAAVYGQPVVKKSKEFRADLKKRPGSAGRNIPGQQDWEKKKQNLVFKERKRREEQQKKDQQDMFEKQHKELIDKQKIDRINRSREEGWRNIVDSINSDNGDDKASPRDMNHHPAVPLRPEVSQNDHNAAVRDKGKYDNYHAYLDRIQQNRGAARVQDMPQPVNRKAGEYMQAPVEVANVEQRADRDYINRALKAPAATPAVFNHVHQAEVNRRYASEAAERAKVVEDFMQRKREAALNKQRGQYQLYGPRPGSAPSQAAQQPRVAAGNKPGIQQNTPGRNREEQEYLQNLKQIREQNMRERRMMQLAEKKQQRDPKKGIEERRKKVEALRRQADDWAKKRKEELEKEKKEILDRMKAREQYMKQRESELRQQKAARPVTPKVDLKPAPAVPITGALHAIGAGADEVPKTPLQQKKNEILKRLNEKPPSVRGKWGAPASPLSQPEEEEEAPAPIRPKWGEADKQNLAQLPLEETASQMEATSARDQVVKGAASNSPAPQVTPRNQWGKPGGTVVGILQGLPLCEETVTLDSKASGGSSVDSAAPVPGVGETITISQTAVDKGTVVIKTADNEDKSKSQVTKKDVADTDVFSSPVESQILKGTFVIGEAKHLLANQKPETIFECTEVMVTETVTEFLEDVDMSEEEMDKSDDTELHENIVTESDQENENSEKKKEIDTDESKTLSPDEMTFDDMRENKDNITQTNRENDGVENKDMQDLTNISENLNEDKDMKNLNENLEKPAISPKSAIPSSKPVLPPKPLLFPKPVLLPKPVLPEELFVKGPEVVKSEEGGHLFDKVQLEDDEDEEQSNKQNHKEKLNTSAEGEKFVCQAITTGQFDIKDVQMMRTASVPDLSKINKSEMEKPFRHLLSRHISLDQISDDVEEQDDIEMSPRSGTSPRSDNSPKTNNSPRSNVEPELNSSSKSDHHSSPMSGISPECNVSPKSVELSKSAELPKQEDNEVISRSKVTSSQSEPHLSESDEKIIENQDEDVENDDDDEDDDDLINVRATMQSLLIDDDDDDDDEVKEGENPSLSHKADGDKPTDTDEALHGEEILGVLEKEGGDNIGNTNENGNQNKNSVSESVESGEGFDDGDDLFDDSDAETQFGDDDDEEDYDLFSRLEQTRMELEQALGFEKFIQVYKAVEALQEDEEENVQEGARIAIDMLGKEKEYLYPKIFQLVIADTAFTDDNA